MQDEEILALKQAALWTRCQVVRQIRMAGSGHLAGSLDLAEVMTFVYDRVLRIRPQQPDWPERDLFLLSAGHVCPVWYATLARRGYFEPDLLLTLRQFGSPLQGHPHRQVSLGIENSAGPLGQGVSQAAGAAWALRETGRQVVVVSSDGEQDEGQVWECYLWAAHQRLKNLTVIIDANGIQQSGWVKQVLDTADLRAKLAAFGWTVEVADGHDFADLEAAWNRLAASDGPRAMICQTIPGKGVPTLENNPRYHAGLPDETGWSEIFADLARQMKRLGVSLAAKGET